MIRVIVFVLVALFVLVGCEPMGDVQASEQSILNDGRILYDNVDFRRPEAVEFRTSTGVLCVAVYNNGANSGAHVTCDWNE